MESWKVRPLEGGFNGFVPGCDTPLPTGVLPRLVVLGRLRGLLLALPVPGREECLLSFFCPRMSFSPRLL